VAGPIEAALIITHHALRGAFAASTTIKDLVDLDAWWKVYGTAKADELIAAALESELASSLLALSLALAARNSTHPSGAWIPVLERGLNRSGRAQARRLLSFFEVVLRGEAPDSTTVALFAPAVYARSLMGPVYREIAWRISGSVPPADDAATVRKPILLRVLRRLTRGWQIGRELAQFRRIGAYRAVARAQSRFH
jgi:ABC-type phosphate/phosphonate transport system permease subunit